jgi:hypothetical protein
MGRVKRVLRNAWSLFWFDPFFWMMAFFLLMYLLDRDLRVWMHRPL